MERNFIVFFLILSYIENCMSGCNVGWVRHGDSCYLFNKESKNWDEAELHCLLYGAKLVEIETEDENNFVRVTLMDHYGHDHHSWIGATDEQSEGQWVWIKSQRIMTFTNWKFGEPNNLNNNENCLFLDGNSDYRWNDAPCDVSLNFICEQSLA